MSPCRSQRFRGSTAPTRSADRPAGGSSGAGSSGGTPVELNAPVTVRVGRERARGTCTCSRDCGAGSTQDSVPDGGLRPLAYMTAVWQRQSGYGSRYFGSIAQIYPDGVAPLVPSYQRARNVGPRVSLESLGGDHCRWSGTRWPPAGSSVAVCQRPENRSAEGRKDVKPQWTDVRATVDADVLRGTVVTCLN